MDIDKEKTMNLPEIGDIIITKKALKLCRYFRLDYLRVHKICVKL